MTLSNAKVICHLCFSLSILPPPSPDDGIKMEYTFFRKVGAVLIKIAGRKWLTKDVDEAEQEI